MHLVGCIWAKVGAVLGVHYMANLCLCRAKTEEKDINILCKKNNKNESSKAVGFAHNGLFLKLHWSS